MNEELQQAMLKILSKTVDTAGKATDFMVAEIPDVIQQLLVWKMWESIFYLGIAIIVIVLWTIAEVKVFKKIRECSNVKDTWFLYLVPGTFVRLIPTIPVSSCLNLTWLQILVAPKLYLIEYASALIK